MKKLNLENYNIKARDKDNNVIDVPYDVKNSLVNVLFHPALKLSGSDLLKAQKLAEKIEDCDKPELLLENEEYDRLKKAVDSINGFSKNDVEFVKRVFEAVDVKSVKEDKEEK